MKISIKKSQRIKLILDLINKKRVASPEKETFYFQYEEFTNLPLLNDQVMLNQLFKRIEEKSGLVFILPKEPEFGKRIVTIIDPAYRSLYRRSGENNNEIEVDKETFESLFTIMVHIEDPEKFDSYRKRIEREITEEKMPIIILNGMGQLYIGDDKEKKCLYRMEKDGSRYKIVYYLAIDKQWQTSKEISEKCEIDSDKVGKTIEQIRRQMEKFLKIDGNKIIESNKGSGYRIKNIKIKET